MFLELLKNIRYSCKWLEGVLKIPSASPHLFLTGTFKFNYTSYMYLQGQDFRFNHLQFQLSSIDYLSIYMHTSQILPRYSHTLMYLLTYLAP